MKAIVIRLLPVQDSALPRYEASADGVKSIIRPASVLGGKQPAHALAKLMCHIYGWSTDLAGGELPNGDEVFCFRNQGRPHV